MASVLDRHYEAEVFEQAMNIPTDLNLLNHEAISGLLKAAFRLAESTSDPDRALDEAATLFADGFPEEKEYVTDSDPGDEVDRTLRKC